LFWLFKAYLKKWGKTIIFSFFIGLIAFFAFKSTVIYLINKIPFIEHEEIGIIGTYTTENLPSEILDKVTIGLTKIGKNGVANPGIAESWKITNDGKKYEFKIKKNVFFEDNTPLTSKSIKYDFRDVIIERPNDYVIVFNLKDAYTPFLITVSQPIYKKGFIGVGEYKIQDINLNGSFIQSLKLESVKNKNKTITYQFYPTEEALKLAYVLGEVTKMINIQNTKFRNTDISTFKNSKVEKNIDNATLVTVFYNNSNSLLSDKKLRKALNYAIPDKFSQGERNYTPYSPFLWINEGSINEKEQDIEKAKELVDQVMENASSSGNLKIELKTLPKHLSIAQILKESWSKIGVETEIKIVEQKPTDFQAFLGEYYLPKDPDQYVLWHSDQQNNITKYKNLRIDKLLEDGRKTTDIEERRKIYMDFQKYLFDDAPASFLINPYVFNISRK